MNRAQRIELTYKQRLKQSFKSGELSREEYDEALKIFHAARDGETPTTELGAQVMEVVADFMVTDDARAALEEWARREHAVLWNDFDKACADELRCSAWDFIRFQLAAGIEIGRAIDSTLRGSN